VSTNQIDPPARGLAKIKAHVREPTAPPHQRDVEFLRAGRAPWREGPVVGASAAPWDLGDGVSGRSGMRHQIDPPARGSGSQGSDHVREHPDR